MTLRRWFERLRRPARYAHLTDEQWRIRRATLRARRASNGLKEPALTQRRRSGDRAFGRLYLDDGGERHA